jgi:hypothetical protein
MQAPRRRTAASLAKWSFAALIVGGAIVDATVLDREPTRQQPNVEVQTAPEPQRSLPAPETANDEAVAVVPRWLVAEEATPKNRIAIDGLTYRISHPLGDGVAVDLAVPGCGAQEASFVVNGVAHDGRAEGAPAWFPDGTYDIAVTCDGALAPATRLVVERHR